MNKQCRRRGGRASTGDERGNAAGLLPLDTAHKVSAFLLVLVSLGPAAAGQDYGNLYMAHSQGNIQLTIARGSWGDLHSYTNEWVPLLDPITLDTVYGCVYPRGSAHLFIDGSLIAGAVAGTDTLFLVSLYKVDTAAGGRIWRISSSDVTKHYYSPEARSELDLECAFYDTSAYYYPWNDYYSIWDVDHDSPLDVRVTQRSMAWSAPLVDDFVLFEYEITNLGHQVLQDFYAGFWCDQIGTAADPTPDGDHLTGFLRRWPFPDQCGYYDTLNVAYMMDDDGDPINGRFTPQSRRGAVGLMLLGSPAGSLEIGYNWVYWTPEWHDDWGPRRRGTNEEPFRSFNPFFAWPGNDENLYYLMSHPYIAYDQMFAAVDHHGWLPPGLFAKTAAAGWSTDMWYSFGPFEIIPRERINFTIAVVGGDNVHTDPTLEFDPLQPQYYYDQLDFSELATNARWAQWVYDNPGVDTDSDGYRGEFRVCQGDTVWYKGDGVPDFRGSSPPPAPFTRFITEPGRLVIRWNGYLCETTKDLFSGMIDFEGYRVYCGLDSRRASLSLLTTYDRLNFFRLKYHELGVGQGKWLNDEPPYSLDSLRIIHHDPDFDPLRYDRSRPLVEGDSVFRFEPVDANQYDLSSMRGIHKVYPDAIDPGTDSTLWTESDITLEHGRPLPRYYEYEYIHHNLLPTVPYFVSVTSFDFGYAGGRGNLPPQESNPLNNLTECYAQTSADTVSAHDLDAYVYPNPYLADAGYHERGYENRAGRIIPDRARLIHFGNLPAVCKISVYSLDGDLIGVKHHDYAADDPQAMHDDWNLVSRAGLAVESGLYYWVVESPGRTQIGKLVILK